ncbi:hypothetical protein AKJ57_03390 [candidate division MSBL1 archaeon SCGC-AAA259A05]|uniref:Rhodanese domain-containing protein n=1 Tax=candidate division MSBL1 archaeon SCGC-AAA259A05 TaxID=1698259 RepID=A0A133U9K4_9EURY|nr:hypothetical protein AKJ57_03390 [candidate division MSBL1 archaeon SCGC-AAA259A05]
MKNSLSWESALPFSAVIAALIIVGGLTAVLFFTPSMSEDYSSGVYENFEAVEAKDLIASEDPVVLDVRTPDEFESGHVPGAILLPVDELRGSTFLEIPHDEEVLVYCRSGRRSSWAAEYLSQKGFARTYNLSGGVLAWKKHGYEIVAARENKPTCSCVVLGE